MSEMNAKSLNQVFEQTYMLMDSIMENPEHCDRTASGKYRNFARAIDYFTSNIRVEDAWSRNDEGHDDNNYFEAGYHESSAIFYPFSENETPEKDDVIHETRKWLELLESILVDIEDNDIACQAAEIKNRLLNMIKNL
jgi:hypothetical protein